MEKASKKIERLEEEIAAQRRLTHNVHHLLDASEASHAFWKERCDMLEGLSVLQFIKLKYFAKK